MKLTTEPFGRTKDNEQVFLYRMENRHGAYVEVISYGCRVRSIVVPDGDGTLRDVCLGYRTLSEYETDDAYFGAAIGRCANVIANAAFSLSGKRYPLDANSGVHHNHGGARGFSACVWDARAVGDGLVFSRTFPDMHDGYPGNLTMQIAYEWTDDNQLTIRYDGIADRDTVLNVTNHTYFNLNGAPFPSVLNHTLRINAEAITAIDGDLIPTGSFLPVEKTPFDFRAETALEAAADYANEQLRRGGGYDHNFVLSGEGYRPVATLCSPLTRIRVTCCTDQPGLQLYTANDLTARTDKYGNTLAEGSGICLETQHFANAVNTPAFPSVVLKKDHPFHTTTAYRFDSVR